jgi:hypothetical protein
MEISELLIEINSHLRQAGFINDADELQKFCNILLDKKLAVDSHNAILIEIAMRCHVKWLGDYYLPHLSQKDWWGKLENLSKATKKHMRRI